MEELWKFLNENRVGAIIFASFLSLYIIGLLDERLSGKNSNPTILLKDFNLDNLNDEIRYTEQRLQFLREIQQQQLSRSELVSRLQEEVNALRQELNNQKEGENHV